VTTTNNWGIDILFEIQKSLEKKDIKMPKINQSKLNVLNLVNHFVLKKIFFFSSFIPVGWNNKSKARSGREVGSGQVCSKLRRRMNFSFY
jgi:hypothetical protein